MSERNKKYLIVFLLSGACLISIFLLIDSSGSAIKFLNSYAEADSLLKRNLQTFNISDNQINDRVVELDSLNRRKIYHVRVPAGFSKTQLHHEIHQTFFEYNVDAPAKVVFPEKDFHIQLIKNNTVFTTIKLQTDPDLVLQRSFGSILVAFDSQPSKEILKQVNALGEPIPVVLMLKDTEGAIDLYNELSKNYSNILFWLRDKEGDNIPGNNYTATTLPKLQQLQEGAPNAGVLSFLSLNDKGTDKSRLQNLSGTELDYIDVSDAVLLQADMGKTAFKQELHKFSRRARLGEYPIAIVMGEEVSLDWLQQELNTFKKKGLRIIAPEKKRFNND